MGCLKLTYQKVESSPLKVVYRRSDVEKKSVQRFLSVDPLAEEFPSWSPYNFTMNNPIRFIDPDGRAPMDIILLGANNSSVTIETDLIDVTVDASSFVGDLGGNYSFSGDDILTAGLDIVGVVDPTPISDGLAASIEAKNGNWGGAILSGLGVIPYVGDLGKVGKIPKHVKTINKAIDGIKSSKKTDFVVTPSGTAVSTNLDKVSKSFDNAGFKKVNTGKNNSTYEVPKSDGTGTFYSRLQKGNPNGTPGYNGDRVINTTNTGNINNKQYVQPNGSNFPNGTSKNARREGGHIHLEPKS